MGYKLQKALRRNRLALTATAAIAFVLALLASLVPWQQKWHQVKFFALNWQTRIGAKTPVDNRLVLIGIDEESLKALGRWPWSRAVHARLIEKLSDAGARSSYSTYCL
jgi:CHASE2 domain-containing sensor protein